MVRPELAPDAPVRGGMLLPRDPNMLPVPLEHTTIMIEVVGPLAETKVVQRFRNRHASPLDALYVFPLPTEAAVSSFELRIGERIIRSMVRERAEAEAAYRAAAARGGDVALVTQERPNLFTIELANLQPGELVEACLVFFSQVPFDDGWFSLAMPTVVLPRYVPTGHPARPQDGVLPLLPEGGADHTLDLRISLDVGRLAEVETQGAKFDLTHEPGGRVTASLQAATAVPDRDLVIRYRPAGEQYRAAAFAYREAGHPGAALIMLTPQVAPATHEVLPREVLFVFDRSGSMGGDSIVQARNALRACLRALNAGDTFNIFPFDDHVERLAPVPLPFTQASVDAADAFIASIQARGGTEIVAALTAALDQPRDPLRLRIVVFLTDGAVGNEDQVLRSLTSRLNEARIFAFGVGSAVNRFLLDELASVGRGSVEYIVPGEAIEPAVQRFQRRAALPLICDLSIDWGGAQVDDLLPDPLPDLYAGQPLILMLRYYGPRTQQVTVTVRGRTPRGLFRERLELDLSAATPERTGVWRALPRLWARAYLARLASQARLDPRRAPALEAQARALAVEYGLLSAHTAFLAEQEAPVDAEGRRATARVLVPVHLPAGTRREAFEPVDAMLGGGASFGGLTGAIQFDAFAASPYPQMKASYAPQSRTAQRAGVRRTGVAGQPAPSLSPAMRREAALRFLARTQEVNGAWAGDEVVTALAVLAFVLAGHTPRSGDFRPQLTRTLAWLAARSEPGYAVALALQVLRGDPCDQNAAAALARDVILAAGIRGEDLPGRQTIGGDTDGAVVSGAGSLLRPTRETLALTAALAILIGP
ncbi:VIT domain-containing protein [Candidatus Chloroploca sp. Khr17]|uniref:VIT domain-containing protein n=1 Tax=Candidatus Chloroploca sp. Khr17 TaxID=2496869 RepID=UPI0013EA4D8A|nr:VIT domain-containing protein [Candidatus Chloroploca sp. Khr17]